MKKFFYALMTFFTIASLTTNLNAQNLSQLDAIRMLNGNWTTDVGIYLNIVGENSPVTRRMTASGSINKQYDNWNIHTNTFDFSSGTIQATNTNPFHNDNYKYRLLTSNTCEFYLNGQWVPARKGGGNNVVTPVNNNNNVLRPDNNSNRPNNNNNVIITPPNNNRNDNNNNGTVTPNTNRPVNNNSAGQVEIDGSTIQLFMPNDVPGTVKPTNNNNNNNNNGTYTPPVHNNNNNNSNVTSPDNDATGRGIYSNGIRPVDNNTNGDQRNIIITPVDNNGTYTPPTHNNYNNQNNSATDVRRPVVNENEVKPSNNQRPTRNTRIQPAVNNNRNTRR